MNRRGLHAGLLLALCVLGPACALGFAGLIASPGLFGYAQHPDLRPLAYAAIGLCALGAALSLTELFVALRLTRGTPGRLRGVLAGYAFAACFAGMGAMVLVLLQLGPLLPSGAVFTLEEALLLSPLGARYGLIACLGVFGLGLLTGLPVALSAWFLIQTRARARFFLAFDLLALAGMLLVSLKLPLTPHGPEEKLAASVRVGVTLLFLIRLAARLLPKLLDLIETLNFRALVAARHLRAKKSGFLAAIAFLSIMAVSVSSCALTTTLSVMGGFRQDLKRKILGNNAHIVVDRNERRIPQSEDPSPIIRAVPEVRGVSPYVSGEVMISSSSNLAGAVLRGIDPEHIAEVSELPRITRQGSLDYLRHPDKLSRLSASQLGLGGRLRLPRSVRAADEEDVASQADSKRLLAELEKALDAEKAQEPSDITDESASDRPAPQVLPGIMVGQELARSLRLDVGDEVNIITPLGALGPTGPMPKSRPFRVAGIFYSGMYEYDMKFAYVTLEAAQQFLNTGPRLSGVEVTVREPERAQEIAQVIQSRLPDKSLRVRAWQELNKNLFGALALEKLAMFIALGIAILVASFCIIGTLTLMVQEKGREVAVLKAMGAADRAIVAIFVLEGTLIGVFGSLLGLALGYTVCFAAEYFGVSLNPEVYYIDRLPVHVDPMEFLAVGLSAVVVCLLVTIYPAQLASRLRPVDALRFE